MCVGVCVCARARARVCVRVCVCVPACMCMHVHAYVHRAGFTDTAFKILLYRTLQQKLLQLFSSHRKAMPN